MAVFFAIFFLVTIVVFAIIASMQKPQKSEMRIDCVAQPCDSMAAYVERLITAAEEQIATEDVESAAADA